MTVPGLVFDAVKFVLGGFVGIAGPIAGRGRTECVPIGVDALECERGTGPVQPS